MLGFGLLATRIWVGHSSCLSILRQLLLCLHSRAYAGIDPIHGREDDVIPYLETEKLAERLPAAGLRRKCITGLYGHTAAGDVGLREVAAEIGALAGMLDEMATAPARRP